MRRMVALIVLLSLASVARASIHTVGLDKSLFTSDFMIGNVVVAVIFPESDGTLDANTETWSEARKSQVLSEIMAGHEWWTRQNPRSPLSFTYVTHTLATKYEPITRPYYHEAYWIPDVLSKLGYSGSRFTAARDYVNDLREEYDADWGFVIFVLDSANDTNGKLPDGFFAYAYLGGPFMVVTYDNSGYGIQNMDVVVAHETGHIFHALDEYAGASSPNDYSHGYFSIVNGNHAWAPGATDPNSIMRGGIRWGLDPWARDMIGWRDQDNNGRDDIVDQTPTVSLSPPSAFGAGGAGFLGRAMVNVLPRQNNSAGNGMTLDTIAEVQYRIGKNNDWKKANAKDGTFDSADEEFAIVFAAAELGESSVIQASDIEIQAVTAFSLGAVDTGPGGPSLKPAPSSLDEAHVYPNPFKPNSDLGHTVLTFTNLTPSAKVQIFTVAGEPVFEATVPSAATTYQWNSFDQDGSPVASGIYFYLLTDPTGNMKKGKFAVMR